MLTTGRSTRLGGLVLAGFFLAGCASQVACTAMGCQSAVVVDVSAVTRLGDTQAGRVKVCIESTENCALALAPQGQHVVQVVFEQSNLPKSLTEGTGPVDVYVSIMNPGTVLVDDKVSTTFTRYAPNGEQCGPVCYTADLVATDRGVTAVPISPSPSRSG